MNAPSTPRLHRPGPLAAGTTVRLDADASHHLVRVLRLAPGEALELFDGRGRRHAATLVEADARGASVTVGEGRDAGTESALALGLAQALPAGDKMDWIVEKAVELGVAVVQPLVARRSVVRLEADRAAKRLAHWRRIAVAACMQSGRDRVPEVLEPVPIARWLASADARARPGGHGPHDATASDASGGDGATGGDPATGRDGATAGPGPLRLVLSPRGGSGLAALPGAAGGAWLLVGPESGLDATEEAAALAAGWQALKLGPRVLRTETAGLAALAALQARFGDLAG